MTESETGVLARKTWRTLEPLHGMIYFVDEAAEEYAKLGVTGRDGYFASRAAPLGEVSAEVVTATFFNFNPDLVHAAIPRAWTTTTPAQLIDARFRAADRAFRRLLGNEVLASPEMERAAALARLAACDVTATADGRALCMAHAQLPWPDEPHLVLWHAQSILREYRGDAHVALLVTHGLSGIDALVSHAGSGDVPAAILQSTRGWSDVAWYNAVESMRERGWLTTDTELMLSDEGRERRAAIEAATDALSAAPYVGLGDAACTELRELVRPWSRRFAETLFARPPRTE